MTLRVILSRKLQRATVAFELLEKLAGEPETVFTQDSLRIAGAERSLLVCIETMIDACELALRLTGKGIGAHARATVERAVAEGLIEHQPAEELESLITFRNKLAHDYEIVLPHTVYAKLRPAAQLFAQLGGHFRGFLKSLPQES